MPAAPFPSTERQRVARLRELGVLDTPPDAFLDRVVAMAAWAYSVRFALVSLVDGQLQWFKARHGLDVAETSRESAFCGYTILQRRPLIVPDAERDERFFDNPLVCGPPYVRFYAGAPLILPDGAAIGTLCVLHDEPRRPKGFDATLLESLRDLVVDELLATARTGRLGCTRGSHADAERALDACALGDARPPR